MVFAFSGTTAVHAGDPVPIPQPDTPTVVPPTEVPPTNTPVVPTNTPVVAETPVIIITQAPPLVQPTNTPVPPTATPAPQQVVAGVQALPRTGSGGGSAGVDSALLALGGVLFAASLATAGLAWRSAKAG
jgi:hypothetical protein